MTFGIQKKQTQSYKTACLRGGTITKQDPRHVQNPTGTHTRITFFFANHFFLGPAD